MAGSGTLLAVLLGLTLGLLSGYFGGLMDEIVMRLLGRPALDPAPAAGHDHPGHRRPLAAERDRRRGLPLHPDGVTGGAQRRARSQDAAVRRGRQAARRDATRYIMFREILPNVLPPLAVEASMRFSYAIFLVASLGFLGLGVQPPSPDWGLMVGEARNWFAQARWVLLFPAGAIALLVVGVGFMSDGLRRMLLPGGVSTREAWLLWKRSRREFGADPGGRRPRAVTYDTDKGPLHTVRDVSLADPPGRDLRPGGRVRLRQDHPGAGRGALPARQRPRQSAVASCWTGSICWSCRRAEMRAHLGRQDHHGAPGPGGIGQPLHPGRRADRRDGPRPPGHEPRPGAAKGARDAGPGAHARPGGRGRGATPTS